MITDSLSEISQYLFDKVYDNRALLGMPIDDDVVNVFYGDQDIITFVPAICIEPDAKRNTLNGVRRRVEIDFSVGIIVYAGKVADPQFNRKQADVLVEAVEALIHADATFGQHPNQLVISSMVDSIESSYLRKGNSVLRASRIMVSAKSQSLLPPNP